MEYSWKLKLSKKKKKDNNGSRWWSEIRKDNRGENVWSNGWSNGDLIDRFCKLVDDEEKKEKR